MAGRHQPEEGADSPESLKEIRLEPNWENTLAFFAHQMRDHGFDRGAKEPIVSLIEQVRYLTQTDPEAVERVLLDLRGDARAIDYHS